MKILKIEFQNINSLRGTNLIDFTDAPFTTSSLFAITGPTGSGKSTILDVISLALFNHVPRLGRISRNEIISKGAILTRNQKEAYAKVTYESRNGIYTSHWSISTARTGNLREYEMEIIDEATGKILDLKKSDVPAKNEELIGLNYNQFIKSVLLAQGEFAQFLRAKKEERGELLEKITGTGIYRQLGKMAFERHKLVHAEIQKQQDNIEIISRDLLHEEQLLDITGELEKKETTCKPLEEEIKRLEKNLELKKTLAEQLKEIDKLVAEKESANLDLKQFIENYGSKIEQHEKVRDFSDELRNWKVLTLECANLNRDLTGKANRRSQAFKDLESCLKEISGFTRLEVAHEEVENRLAEFSEKVSGLQRELDVKLVEYKNLQREFRSETRELSCELNEKDPEATGKQLEELQNNAKREIKRLEEELENRDLKDPEAEKQRIKKELAQAREALSQHDKIDRISTEIKRLKAEKEKLLPLLETLPEEIKINEEKTRSCRDRIEIINLKKQNQLLLANLEEHRAQLREGEPCPLCGATHHPFAKNLPQKNDALEKELKIAEEEFAKWNGKLAANTSGLELYRKNYHLLDEDKAAKEKDLTALLTDFKKNYSHLTTGNETNWKKVCSQLDRELEDLEKYQKEKRSMECVDAGLPLIRRMREVSTKGKELREDLLAIYKGEDVNKDTRKLQTRWTSLRELEKAVHGQIQELQEKIDLSGKKLKDLEEELSAGVAKKGFEDITKAGEALLPDPEYFRLHEQRDKIRKLIAASDQSLKILTSQLEKTQKDDVQETEEEITIRRQEQLTSLHRLQQDCQHLKRLLLNDRENREKINRIKEEIEEKEKSIRRWRLLNELIGDSTGKKFNDFAQDLSLSQLLRLANKRLKDLSDRYQIDKPDEDEDDGLVAIDEHMGGQRRSVKTLSGGETFLLSLSMALALSDLASRNVEINSLFIDEGFGTLDPETLDQTLDTLEKLQAESSKTIGIISHVDSLKERIATQIRLTRNGQGYSSLEVR